MDFSILNESLKSKYPHTLCLVFPEDGTLKGYPLSKFVSVSGLNDSNSLIEFIDKKHGISLCNQVILRASDGKRLDSSMNLKEFCGIVTQKQFEIKMTFRTLHFMFSTLLKQKML